MKKFLALGLVLLLAPALVWGQFDFKNPQNYILSGLEVEGAKYSDPQTIAALSGLTLNEGVTIPGLQISDAIKRLWKENIFSDVSIRADKIVGNTIFLIISVTERPRIAQYSFEGISKSQADDLREKINFIRGTILTESKSQSAKRIIRNYFVEKGFYNTEVSIEDEPDKVIKNGVAVSINVDRGKRIKISEIIINGNENISDKKVIKKLKKVNEKKWYRLWARSKYLPKEYKTAKDGLIQFYHDGGYRDALIARDSVYRDGDETVKMEIDLYEGQQYFVRNIEWAGNFKYNSETLERALGVSKGDIYSSSRIQERLFGDPQGGDLSSLYLDDGYLFFNLEPVEVAVTGDSIDLEMRIREGPQATISEIIIEGNTKTSDYVILREMRTTPGRKFSRSDIIRSQREILALNYFDQEKMDVQPIPDPATGTVAIKYTLEERPSDQLQLQGGWGGRIRDAQGNVLAGGFVGTVQLAFNNFSARRFFEPKAWKPVPSGDGQRLSLAFQMNGVGYQNVSLSFQEPWLGGKRPNSLGISTSYILYQNFTNLNFRNTIYNASVDYGRRMKFPDDFFRSLTSVGYKYYDVLNPASLFPGFEGESQAFINIITLKQAFERSSVDAPIYPRSGSILSLSVEATPPWSLLFRRDTDFSELSDGEKFKLLEYHKWRFNTNWFFRIVGNMVLSTKIEAGFLGSYNPALGTSPFERYFLGGTGLLGQNFALDGRELIPLRGYEDNSITNEGDGYPIYTRYVLELRYPITLNQSAPVWVQAFAEAGNGYQRFKKFNPFAVRRAAGFGLRVMLPMVGLLGLDWAYGFDHDPGTADSDKSQFHFIIGQQF